MEVLKGRQREILEYIQEYQREHGYPPTIREIGEAVGLASGSTVYGHLNRLEKKGYVRRDPSKPRALEIVEDGVVRPKLRAVTWVRVSDNGMSKAGIRKGEMVLVQPCDRVADGEVALVATRWPDAQLVRRVYTNGREKLLEADSDTEKDRLTVDAEVLGKVIGMIRLFETDMV